MLFSILCCAFTGQAQEKFTLASAQEYALDHAYGVQIAELEIQRARQSLFIRAAHTSAHLGVTYISSSLSQFTTIPPIVALLLQKYTEHSGLTLVLLFLLQCCSQVIQSQNFFWASSICLNSILILLAILSIVFMSNPIDFNQNANRVLLLVPCLHYRCRVNEFNL